MHHCGRRCHCEALCCNGTAGGFVLKSRPGKQHDLSAGPAFRFARGLRSGRFHCLAKPASVLRYIHDEFNILLPNGFSCATDVPSCPENRSRPGTSYQVAHTWTITPTLINEAKINASWNGQRLFPVGDSWKRSTYGFAFPQLFRNSGGGFRNSIPDIMISTLPDS